MPFQVTLISTSSALMVSHVFNIFFANLISAPVPSTRGLPAFRIPDLTHSISRADAHSITHLMLRLQKTWRLHFHDITPSSLEGPWNWMPGRGTSPLSVRPGEKGKSAKFRIATGR